MTQPITFTTPSYCVMDMARNAVFTTVFGNLCIFTIEALAEKATAQLLPHYPQAKVVPVMISPKSVTELNPDAVILEQMREHWQKLAALLVWKLAEKGVTLTYKEMAEFPQDMVLLTHGHKDSIEFKLVTQDVAKTIVEHDRKQKGHA